MFGKAEAKGLWCSDVWFVHQHFHCKSHNSSVDGLYTNVRCRFM